MNFQYYFYLLYFKLWRLAELMQSGRPLLNPAAGTRWKLIRVAWCKQPSCGAQACCLYLLVLSVKGFSVQS